MRTGYTDENGEVVAPVIQKCRGRISVGNKEDGPTLYRSLDYEVNGIEDNGKEFTLQVTDKILQHLSGKRLQQFLK